MSPGTLTVAPCTAGQDAEWPLFVQAAGVTAGTAETVETAEESWADSHSTLLSHLSSLISHLHSLSLSIYLSIYPYPICMCI